MVSATAVDGGSEVETVVPEISFAALTGVAMVDAIRFAGFVQPTSMAFDTFDYIFDYTFNTFNYAMQIVAGEDGDEDGDDSPVSYSLAELGAAAASDQGDVDRADLNRDGVVDARDFELLKRRLVGGGSGS